MIQGIMRFLNICHAGLNRATRSKTTNNAPQMQIIPNLFDEEEAMYGEQKTKIEHRLENIKKLQEEYLGRIRLRYTPITNVTSRRIICYAEKNPYFAIDTRKILSFNPKGSSFHIGTIYLQKI